MIPPVSDGTEFTAADGTHWRMRLEPVMPGPTFQAPGKIIVPALELGRPPHAALKPQRPHQQTVPGAPPPPRPNSPPTIEDDPVLDHSVIGGRFTICVLCFGPYHELHRRCLESIFATVPRDRFDLRVGANAVTEPGLSWLRSMVGHQITKLYEADPQIFKYPMMRRMYWDPECPLGTNYVVWFDDDSWAKPKWHIQLARTIVTNHTNQCRLYGIRFVHDLAPYIKQGKRPDLWFRAAPWYNGRHWEDGRNTESPNGGRVVFASGGCHCIGVDSIRRGQIPDERLQNNGGDITVGGQNHQAGYKMKDWNRGKVWVQSSDHARRGVTHPFPWLHQGA